MTAIPEDRAAQLWRDRALRAEAELTRVKRVLGKLQHATAPSNRLRELREGANMSREYLAVQFNVLAATVEYWERVSIPSPRLKPLAQFFGVTVDRLLGLDRETTS